MKKNVLAALLLALLLSSCAGMSGTSPKIRLGMTPAEVQASWGRPDYKSRSISKWGTTEFWRYGDYRDWMTKKYFLMFQNGELVDISD